MKLMVSIPRGVTQGADLVVIRRSEYDALQRRLAEFKDAFGKIKRGEKELKEGKTQIVSSLAELR